MVSAGVKMTLSLCCPAVGAVVDVLHAKVPLTVVPFAVAVPPVSVDDASVWPYVIALAEGNAEMVGVTGVFVVVPLPPPQPATNRTAPTSQKAE